MFLGEHGFLDALGLDSKEFGVAHSDELYLFWFPYWYQNFTLNPADATEGEKLVSFWTNFAKSGDPTPPGTEVTWEGVAGEKHEYLEISNEGFSMKASEEYLERVTFWGNIMSQRPQ